MSHVLHYDHTSGGSRNHPLEVNLLCCDLFIKIAEPFGGLNIISINNNRNVCIYLQYLTMERHFFKRYKCVLQGSLVGSLNGLHVNGNSVEVNRITY